MLKGIVLYCDGGNHGKNPGMIGYGIHGYTYQTCQDIVNYNDEYKYTQIGYVKLGEKETDEDIHDVSVMKKTDDKYQNVINGSMKVRVEPVKIFNKYSKVGIHDSNIGAELRAFRDSLDIIKKETTDEDIAVAHVYSDCKNVVSGFNDYLPQWSTNGFRKKDGNKVQYEDIWQDIHDQLSYIKSKDTEVKLHWIKGHDGHPGNEQADYLATIAASIGRKIGLGVIEDDSIQDYDLSQVDSKASIHPFLMTERFYFNPSRIEHHLKKIKNGKPVQYYLGELGSKVEDTFVGKEISDAALAVCSLQQSDVVLDRIMLEQARYLEDNDANTDCIVAGMLDHIAKSKVYPDLLANKDVLLKSPGYTRAEIKSLYGDQITLILDPPFLAMRTLSSFTLLEEMANYYLQDKFPGEIVDITELLYEESNKGKVQFKKAIGTDVKSIKAKINIGEIEKTVTLTFGIDLLERNVYKKLEKDIDKVVLLNWSEEDSLFMNYAVMTILKNHDWCIYQATYSSTYYKKR